MDDVVAFEPAAELCGATKRYGTVAALDGVDLALAPGEVTALLGPNGAGKTTAVKLLLGLIRPSAGEARLFGRDPRKRSARVRVGAMMQIAKVPETLKVKEHLKLFASYYPRPLPPAEAMAVTGLEGLAERPFGKLSGGQRQRLLLALAVCGDPDLLFLDEPTVGLDVEARRAFWSAIRRFAGLGKTILLTTHYLEEADALSDRIVVLNRGRIAALGTPAEVKARSASRRVRCVTRLSPAEARELPGVKSARLDGAWLEILTGSAERVVRELLARDDGLTGLEVSGAGLEEAFLALTSEPAPAGPSREKGAA